MATLERIRNKAGVLVVVVIGLALFAFVMQDLAKSGKSYIKGNRGEMGIVGGEAISQNDFNRNFDEYVAFYKRSYGKNLDETMTNNIREQVWRDLVNEKLIEKEAEKSGFSVGVDELADMVQGQNPHPLVRQVFTNKEGAFDKNMLAQFLQNWEMLNIEQQQQWLFIEKIVEKERRLQKYNTLISKGLYPTKLEIEQKNIENTQSVDFDFVQLSYNSIADSTIEISASDIKKYYKQHKNQYKQDASRDIAYITFDINPSAEDDLAARNWVESLKAEFVTTESPIAFINGNSDSTFNYKNYKKGELSEPLNEFMFSNSVGAVYGPYFENGSYRLSKLIAVNQLPDSVNARHILIRSRPKDQALALADSLIGVINGGTPFADVAKAFSEDGSAQTGGDLGFFAEGSMVKPFSDSCFYGSKDKLMVVETQFGVHIIEVLAQTAKSTKVQVGTIVRQVEPSNDTYMQVYSKCNEFSGKNNTYEAFVAAAQQQRLQVREAAGVIETQQNIQNFQSAREIVRWVFKAEDKQVSPTSFQVDNQLVIVALKQINAKGFADVKQVEESIKAEVLKEKKAEMLIKQIKESGAKSVDEIAQKLKLNHQQAFDITFASYSVASAGVEPKVAAVASTLKVGKMAEPVIGYNGVFVMSATNVNQPAAISDYKYQQMMMLNNLKQRASYEALEAVKKDTKVEDFRALYY